MTKEEIFEKVKKILVKNIHDYRKNNETGDEITLDLCIDYDLGADSLDKYFIADDIASVFQIDYYIDEDTNFYHPGITVDEICVKIQEELNKK